MGMQIGIVGKPNVGKSTFFNAATEAHAEIANYPFTTIEANRGVMYVRKPCPCQEFKVTCTPHNSECRNGIRFVPIETIDVAGLVPDAHKGKGLGNKFLDDLRQADALIHIIDASGSTDAEGNPITPGTYDPLNDVAFLEKEITYWLHGILMKDWERIARQSELENKKIERMLAEKLTGLGIKEEQILKAIKVHDLDTTHPSHWNEEELLQLSDIIRQYSKPMLIAFNKCDIASDTMLEKMDELTKKKYIVIPTSAEAELALTHAAKKDILEYTPGSNKFTLTKPDELSDKQRKALEFIQTKVLDTFGSTGIQRCIEESVKMLDLIVVYPVEDEAHLTDKNNRILPDAFLIPRGSNAKDLAYKVHTDLGDHFIRAIDARTHRVIGADHKLQDGDVISIIADV
jgi:ribosome-binding ATPase YchF (GTP1/OBG family)